MQSKKPATIDPEQIELRPDGEARYLAAIHAAARSGPKHRTKEAKPSVVVEDERQD